MHSKTKKILFDYEIKPDNTIMILGFNGDTHIKKITVPLKIDGRYVTGIAENAFEHCRSVESLPLPEELKTINQSVISTFKNLNYVIINNPEIKIEPDTFLASNNLKYIILHRNLYNELSKDNYPGASGKVGFDKYGINTYITQLVPFGAEFLSIETSNNLLNMFENAIANYNANLSLIEKLKAIFNGSFEILFDKYGNFKSTIYAYEHVKKHIRDALSKSDNIIVSFITELAKMLDYDEYNSFETFDEKINDSLYIAFINAVENNRMSVLRDWFNIEFRRYDHSHRKRDEYMVVFYNFVIRRLVHYFYQINNPTYEDLLVISAFVFSKPSIEENDISDFIDYINKANSGSFIDGLVYDTCMENYAKFSGMDLFEVASTIILFGFFNGLIDEDDVIDHYYPIGVLKESETGMDFVKTLSTALSLKVEIPKIMKLLRDTCENDGKFDAECLNELKLAVLEYKTSNPDASECIENTDEYVESSPDDTSESQTVDDNPDPLSASLVQKI